MNDMRSVIVPRSDQMNADDLLAGPRTITIERVTIRPGTEQPVSINFEGDGGKPYKPCKSMARVMVHAWGPDANEYVGRSMTLYCDPKVKWGGMEVGGIRISHMSHIDGKLVMALTETKGHKKPFTVQLLKASQMQTGQQQQKPMLTIPEWIVSTFVPHLAKCATAADVEKATASRGYQSALVKATDDEKAELQRLVDEARVRVSPPSEPSDPFEDPDFPATREAAE